MQMIEALRQIEQLKYRYMKALDTHDWATFAACFSEHATASYADGALSFEGRDAITLGISTPMDSPFKISTHMVHHPQLELLTPTTAKGSWYLQDFVICEEEGWLLQGAAFYHDKYVLENGEWLYSHIGYERSFETRTPLPEGFRITERASYFR